MKSKKKQLMKRCIAVVLTFALLLPSFSQYSVQAEPVTYEETTAYDLEEMKAQLLESDEAKAITVSTVTFPVTSAIMQVDEELIYHVFRQGNTEKEETITIGTYDLTAGYSEDYEILVDGKTIDGEAKKMLDGTGTVYDVYLDENVLEGSSSEESTEDETTEDVDEQAEMLKEMTSTMFDITFAPGETTKEIRIRAFVPDKAVGNKNFQMMIMEVAEGMEVGINGTAAFTLQDSRETEEASIEIDPDSVEVVDGYVTVMVERSGNTESYENYTISADNGTAENGIDYVLNAAQLTFTPGVTQQRVHIPLVSSETEEEKSFTLRAGSSEEVVTYTTTLRGATFAQSIDKIDIPMSEFVRGGYTADEVDFYYNEEGHYIFSFDTGIGDGDHRTASIYTSDTYDFTGIEFIRISASYRVGTILGDFLDVYASNTDYYNNLNELARIPTNYYGSRIDTVSLTGQKIHDIYVDRIGEYSVYMTAEQHNGCGYIGYNLYDQEFDGSKEGHVALIKKGYKLTVETPEELYLGGSYQAPAGNLKFTKTSDSASAGTAFSNVYRDESFAFSYTAIDDAFFKGYELLDDTGEVIFRRWTDSTLFCVDSEILRYVESNNVSSIRVRPIFEKEDVDVTVATLDFFSMGLSNLSAVIDSENCTAVYYDDGVEIATVTWNKSAFSKGDTLKFTVQDNYDYDGEYHFDSFKVRSNSLSDLSDSNPIYYTDRNWNITLTRDFYEIIPMFSCADAPLYLIVKDAAHGSFIGKPDTLEEDGSCTVTLYDGVYAASDIVRFVASPDDGYRAKWTYQDVATGKTKTYYGNVFYYQVQFPMTSTDNYVTLEFVEDAATAQTYTMTATVYMQGGNILHQPDPDSTDYSPLQNAQVSIGGTVRETLENGSTGENVYTITGKAGETYTAEILANNRSYIHEITLPESNASSFNEEICLSYYYEGPRVTSIKYYDDLGASQNGDTIFLQDQLESVVIAAEIETNNKEVTDVLFTLTDSEGTAKMESVEAEVNGNEYLWTVQLGTYAQEGDQIWIELINRQTDDNGNEVVVSYGKVNTGYSIVMAEYSYVSYIPDTGNKSVTVPIFGNMFFNFSIKGIKPVITTSKSGNLYFLTLGMSPNFMRNFTAGKWIVPDWKGFNANRKAGMQVFSQMGDRDAQKAAVQTMKKSTLSFNFPVTFTLAFYINQSEDGFTTESYFVGAYFAVGVNTTYQFSYPFLVYMLPMYANLQVTLAFTDTIQIYDRTDTGLIELAQMSDPTKTAYRPSNDLNVKLDVGLSLGVGVNSVLSASGGGTGTFAIDWIDYSYGKGVMSFALNIRVELLLFGRTFSKTIKSWEIFNTNPYTATRTASADQTEEMEDILSTKLSEFKMRSLDSYDQAVLDDDSSALRTSVTSSYSSNGRTLISDAYDFSRPELTYIGDGRYLIVATVNSAYVNGYTGSENTAVMSYAIYNSNTGSFEKEEGEKAFTTLEPSEEIGNSLNFNPSVVSIGDDGYVIVWNSLLYGTSGSSDDLTLDKMRMVIKSAVLKSSDSESGKVTPIYESLVVTNDTNEIMPSLVTETVYDENADKVLLLYRTLDFSDLTEESTLRDYSNVGTTLSITSLDVSDEALAEHGNIWSESVALVANGSNSVIKNADMAMMQDGNETVPIITYHMVRGENAGILNEAEEDTTNHIYLASLKSTGSGYKLDKYVEVPLDTEEYQANPKLATGAAGDLEPRAMLMWRQSERIAVADPIDILNDAYSAEKSEDNTNNGQTTGLAAIHEVFAGNNEDFRLIEGEDGKLYCLWTEGYSDGTENGIGSQVMMSVLQQDDTGVAYWTEGKAIYNTTNCNYIQSISAVVDENGHLQSLFRETDLIDDEGTSRVQLKSVRSLRSSLQSSAEEEDLLQSYVYSASGLEISSIDYEPLNVTDGTNPDIYKVKATITNAGDEDAEATELVVSYLKSENADDGTDSIKETALGQTTVPALAAGESTYVEFEITVAQEYYASAFKIAPVGVALYKNYGTDDQAMVDMMLDGVQAKGEEEATELETSDSETVAVSRNLALQTSIYPRTAQRFTNLKFTSSDTSIATVDANGVVTGLKEGTCIITVTTDNELTKNITFTVTKEDTSGGSVNDSSSGETPTGSDSTQPSGNNGSQNASGNQINTGDSANVLMWIVICAVAAGTTAIIFVYRRKKAKS